MTSLASNLADSTSITVNESLLYVAKVINTSSQDVRVTLSLIFIYLHL
ncbi:hypothetical protein JCM19240_3405 [Vibrio maritimus]|uniref:Uncharacterized protein n=1 Tax=Vibrio maritimus TaxID=990268 RepID=A0A090T505_9VIBR|nr:hypothetical protein JCM19240_3405 [Vibrio maritimus]